jgi:hypothetical protein
MRPIVASRELEELRPRGTKDDIAACMFACSNHHPSQAPSRSTRPVLFVATFLPFYSSTPCPSMQLFPTVYVPSSTWPLQPTSQPARMKKAFQLAGVYIFGWKPGHE